MMFRNSLKLFVANFSVFWKLLLYKIIAICICGCLLIPIFSDWNSCLVAVNFEEILTNFATNTVFTSTIMLLKNLFLVIDAFLSAFSMLLSVNAFAFFYTIFVLCIVLPILINLSSIPTGEGLYSYMASLNKSSFVATYVTKFGRSLLFSILKTIVFVPLVFVIMVGLYYLLSLTSVEGILQVFLPMIVILYFVFCVSILITTFCGWMPATIVFNCSPIISFKKGLKAVFRRYFKVLSSVIVIIFSITMLSFMFTTFSLIALIPLGSVALIMLSMVMFFESQGMRYYVDIDTIVSPKKLEQCDKFKKVKDII